LRLRDFSGNARLLFSWALLSPFCAEGEPLGSSAAPNLANMKDIAMASSRTTSIWPRSLHGQPCLPTSDVEGALDIPSVSASKQGHFCTSSLFFRGHDFARINVQHVIPFLNRAASGYHLKCKQQHFRPSLEEAKMYGSPSSVLLWIKIDIDASSPESTQVPSLTPRSRTCPRVDVASVSPGFSGNACLLFSWALLSPFVQKGSLLAHLLRCISLLVPW
ncbi:hypothetical protein Taro_046037, partial [Colocasia esculenta]|nr:hypothetical protein [Colocasia esculenta]